MFCKLFYNYRMKFCLVLILLILKLTHKVSGQCIQFQFDSQPPTELDCNPYNVKLDPAEWRLRVSCDVRRISGTDLDQFDVHWFHKNNENEIIDLGQVEVQGESPHRELVVLGTQWVNTPFDESMLGEYWCQVIVTSTQPNMYLGKSDILVIRDPQDYDTGLSRCQGIITVSTTKCADGIQSSLCVSSSSSCTNPITTEGVQLSSTESRSSSSQHIPSETNPITTEQVTCASTTENMSFSSKLNHDTSSTQTLATLSPSSCPSPSVVPSQLNSGDNTQLIIIAGSIGGALFLLILILLIIIGVLICIKNGRKNNRKSDSNGHIFRMSSIRSSTHPLVNNSNDVTQPGTALTAPLVHRYSTVSDSFPANPTQENPWPGVKYPPSLPPTNTFVDSDGPIEQSYSSLRQPSPLSIKPVRTKEYSILRVDHYTTIGQPDISPTQVYNQLEHSTKQELSPIQDYSKLDRRGNFDTDTLGHDDHYSTPYSMVNDPPPIQDYSKLDRSGNFSKEIYNSTEVSSGHGDHHHSPQDRPPLQDYNQLDYSMGNESQPTQNYSKLDRSGNFDKDTLGHDDHYSTPYSMVNEPQPIQDYSKLDRSGNFSKEIYNSMEVSSGHGDQHSRPQDRPPLQDYNQLDYSMGNESQPTQDYRKLDHKEYIGKEVYNTMEVPLRQSPHSKHSLEKLFDDPRYSTIESVTTDSLHSADLEQYEYSTISGSHDGVTKTSGTKAISLEPPSTRHLGNYERDPNYVPVKKK